MLTLCFDEIPVLNFEKKCIVFFNEVSVSERIVCNDANFEKKVFVGSLVIDSKPIYILKVLNNFSKKNSMTFFRQLKIVFKKLYNHFKVFNNPCQKAQPTTLSPRK